MNTINNLGRERETDRCLERERKREREEGTERERERRGLGFMVEKTTVKK